MSKQPLDENTQAVLGLMVIVFLVGIAIAFFFIFSWPVALIATCLIGLILIKLGT